jgi:ribosomal protein S18 acetylase RimI-like enzyme
VRTPAELDTYIGVYAPILSPSPAFTELFSRAARRIGFGREAREEHFVGYLHGDPVATVSLVTAGGTAGIYNVTTVEAARGRGIGAAMTVAAARHGAARGFDLATLQASRMGRPVYERLGFEFVCDLHPYREP